MNYMPVRMIRPDLSGVPQYPLPNGYSVRLFRKGDDETWVRVERAAEPFIKITDATFRKEFADDLGRMPRRCHFLLSPDGREIGTITAWFVRKYRRLRWGRIHWVAIVRDYQGRGLSKPMMTVAMNRLRALGHRRAMLDTQVPRIAAIKVYLDFGFIPDMSAKDAHRAWSLVRRELPSAALDRALTGGVAAGGVAAVGRSAGLAAGPGGPATSCSGRRPRADSGR